MISFEGLDGAGKSTQTQRLKEALEKDGFRVLLLTSPSRSLVGRIIRANLMNMEDHNRDRLFAYDIKRASRQIDGSYDLVLWDRHLDSIYTSNADTKASNVEKLSIGILVPHKVIFLDIMPEVSWQRESAKSDHPLNMDWLMMKYERYQELLEREPERFIVIESTRPIDEVFEEILSSICDFLKGASE